ncbi:MAG TPA: quinone-dependent dihydroorotate dehydrogenase [Aestuariivirgaceae bacterium]|jgi:dihydroorotate dehydrogenase
MAGLYVMLRPLLFLADPELAHGLALAALKAGLVPATSPPSDPGLEITLWGLKFPNPVGLAAGFDKNAEVADAMLALGFGFVEVGSITPLAQVGNPKPRLFRLEKDRALINRLGFNNAGQGPALARLKARSRSKGILGVNIGASRDSSDPIADYVSGLQIFSDVAAFITVNISSPNTPGLRALQSKNELADLLNRLASARSGLAHPIPLLLKIAPDLSDLELADIAAAAIAGNVDGIVVSNTTVSRPVLKSPQAAQMGGLSGPPLFELSTRQLARLYRLTAGRMPLIGAGGVSSAETAWQKIRAGASLLQLYTALVYEGPSIVAKICAGLNQRLEASGKSSISEIVGTGLSDWL